MGADPGRKTRAFVAVDLPSSVRDSFAAYLGECARREPGLRWVPPQNLHLTLRFVGSVGADRLASLDLGLSGLLFPAFDICLDGLGGFGTQRRTKVVWIGVASGAAPLSRLAGEIEALCQGVGLKPESRPFRPHMTLARSRVSGGQPVGGLPAPEPSSWTVDSLALMASELKPSGAVYTVIGRHPLLARST